MALCFYVLGAFLPSLRGWCRNAHPGIKTRPEVLYGNLNLARPRGNDAKRDGELPMAMRDGDAVRAFPFGPFLYGGLRVDRDL